MRKQLLVVLLISLLALVGGSLAGAEEGSPAESLTVALISSQGENLGSQIYTAEDLIALAGNNYEQVIKYSCLDNGGWYRYQAAKGVYLADLYADLAKKLGVEEDLKTQTKFEFLATDGWHTTLDYGYLSEERYYFPQVYNSQAAWETIEANKVSVLPMLAVESYASRVNISRSADFTWTPALEAEFIAQMDRSRAFRLAFGQTESDVLNNNATANNQAYYVDRVNIILTAPVLESTPEAAAVSIFSDVPENHWAAQAINNLAGQGLIKGQAEGIFAPSATITRAEFVALLANLGKADLKPQDSGFSDVALNAWYNPAIAWAKQQGILVGVNGAEFSPQEPITRQDLAAYLAGYLESQKLNLTFPKEPADFTDQAEIADYAKPAVSLLQQAGLLQGRGDNCFAPLATATRAEAAVLLFKVLQLEK